MSLSIPKSSPLRRTHPFFYGIRINDEGAGRINGFYDLVNKGKIDLVAPARVVSFGADQKSVVLNNGQVLNTNAIVLATGFKSSWNKIFDRMFTVPMKR
jgi:dimethylaniline monooxygenase (N-oxide forming)